MKKYLSIVFLCFLSTNIYTQDIYEDVYNVFQNNCMPCHNSATQTANLDLEGVGANTAQKMADVYAKLYKQTPANSVATANKNFLIYPGDPYKSFLYRKMDHGLTAGLQLETGEGTDMPIYSFMIDKEIELVRQWILYGAQETGAAFDKTLMEDYYDNGGVESVANPPMPPAPGEGFQIHLGPYYVEPGGEIEYFSKYDLLLDSDLEIHKIQTEMGSFSHHFIVYKFSSTFGNVDPNLVPYGMREGQDFDGREFVSVDQYSNTLTVPEGAAFLWDQESVLDLNTHYINYSSTQVLKCEVFYNVYTQATGTANQIMEVNLIPNTNIPIPNDNIPVTFENTFQLGADVELFIWGLTSHTHSYGKDFNIYKKTSFDTRGEQIYDAGCANGIPGCNIEDFDYSHLPIRFFSPFEIVNIQDGLEAEATFQNDGPVPVDWGFTSADEMMIFIAFYLTDTTGVDMSSSVVNTSIKGKEEIHNFKLYPNPIDNILNFEVKNGEAYSIEVYDVNGKKLLDKMATEDASFDVSNWTDGLYLYLLKKDDKFIAQGKFLKK
ncbi:MAG: hypothetical protein ACI8ZX_000746 [Planctomycetota bacterium]|jgi:hypothetical protein